MNIVLTGNRGFIGSRLAKKIKAEGIDLKDGVDCINYENDHLKTIYHLAGQSGAIPSTKDPLNDARQNILGTIKMIQLANKNMARLIFPTSGASKEPESPYGLSKKTAEEYIKMTCDDYVILRFSSIFGEKEKGVVDNFIREKECVVYGDGTATRDFVHVDDIVEALLIAKDAKKGIYECGSGKGVTVLELAEATKKPIVYKEKRQGEKQKVVLKNELKTWQPKINVLKYIHEKC